MIKSHHSRLYLLMILIFCTWIFWATFPDSNEFIIKYRTSDQHNQIQQTREIMSPDALPKWDFTQLVNFENFKFDLMNSVCNTTSLLFLVLIHSAPRNIEKRKAIRETWGQPHADMRLVFLFGAVDSLEAQELLQEEDEKHHDIVQGNFKDHYRNLTYKHIMAYKYAIYYCSAVKFIMKIDDDIFVNIPTATSVLKNSLSHRNLLQCNILYNSPVLRNETKWAVTFEEYPSKHYPTYCLGYALLLTWDVVYRLYREAQKGEYYWIDDVHITGTLAKRLNLKHKPLGDYSISRDRVTKFIASNASEESVEFIFGPLNMDPETMHKLWNALQLNKEFVSVSRV